MKHLNKLTALLLALAMVLALAVTVFAAGEQGSITIENPQKDRVYTAYKIFDVVYNGEKTAYAYTIKESAEATSWFPVILEYMYCTINDDGTFTPGTPTDADGVYTGNGITLTPPASDPDTYVVTMTDRFSAPSFAKYLNLNKAGKTGTPLTPAGSKAEATGLALGYYFVSSDTGSLCNLTTTNPSVTIHDKNDMPFDKVGDKTSVEIGEVVSYTITCRVPDTSDFTTYDYVITDKMSEGLTMNKDSIQIWISNDDQLDTAADKQLDLQYYIMSTEGAKDFAGTADVDFRVDFKAIEMNGATPSLVGKYIFITYTATVNENAVAKIEKNTATLTYSNDPTDHESHGTRTEEPEVYSAKILIDKYAANPNDPSDTSGKKLEGASFVLYKNITEGTTTTTLYYKYDDTANEVKWVNDKTNATVMTTDGKGAAEFIGLKDGTYYLLETAAPAGYNLLKDPVEITVSGAGAAQADLTHTVGVANNTGAELPSTGGPGTTLFYILGGVLAVSAAVLLITKRRVRAEE